MGVKKDLAAQPASLTHPPQCTGTPAASSQNRKAARAREANPRLRSLLRREQLTARRSLLLRLAPSGPPRQRRRWWWPRTTALHPQKPASRHRLVPIRQSTLPADPIR